MAVQQLQQDGLEPDSEGDDSSYLGKTISDIVRCESLHAVAAEKFLCWQTSHGQAFGYNTDDQHLLNFMPQLRRLHARIMERDEPLAVPTFVRWAKRPGVKLSKLGKDVLDACMYFASQENERRNWQEAYAHHRFHPVITVLLRAVMRWWKPICRWGEPSRALIDGQEVDAVNKLHHFVDFVRRVCRSQAFRNVLHDHERKAEDNFRSGCNYITALFGSHSRLLILRVDLYFRPDAKKLGYSKAAHKAVLKYLRALRMGRIVPGYHGYIIKRENGISRGAHYHLMVILDGHLHKGAWFLTQRLGEKWIKRVGYDKGSFFNCYARKDRYRYNGLGLVHVSEMNKLIGIRNALWYMSKQDSELKVDKTKVKNFWRSLTPKGPGVRGAPRKNKDGMCLVRNMLGGERSKYPPGFESPKPVRATR